MNPDRHPIPASTFTGVVIQAAVLAMAAAMGWAAGNDQPSRAAAVGFAAAVCLGGVVGGWAAALWRGSTPAARVTAALAVVALRIFPALVALGWLQTPAGFRLREAGAGGMLVAFYLAVLAVDVFLNIMGTRGSGSAAGSKRAN
jgi:heme A synthase